MLREAFSATHAVDLVEQPGSMTDVAAHGPHVMILGPLRASGGSLGTWEFVALARAHRDLRHVPIVVLTPDLDHMMTMQADRFQRHSDVWVVGMPFDLDILAKVLAAAEREWVGGPQVTSMSVA